MTPQTIHLLRKSLAPVEAQQQVAALIFFRRLFQLHPSLRNLFSEDIEAQGCRFMEMLSRAVALLERPAEWQVELQNLGRRHLHRGVLAEHYPIAGRALIDMFSSVLGSAFTPQVRKAWEEFYSILSTAMLEGAKTSAPNPTAPAPANAPRHSTPPHLQKPE